MWRQLLPVADQHRLECLQMQQAGLCQQQACVCTAWCVVFSCGGRRAAAISSAHLLECCKLCFKTGTANSACNSHAFMLAVVQCGCSSTGARVGPRREEVCFMHTHAGRCRMLEAQSQGHFRYDLAYGGLRVWVARTCDCEQ